MTDTINIFIQKYLNIFEFMNNHYCFCNIVYTIEPDTKVMEVRAQRSIILIFVSIDIKKVRSLQNTLRPHPK